MRELSETRSRSDHRFPRRAGRQPAVRAACLVLLAVAAPALVHAPTPLPAQPPNHARGFEPRNTFELGDLEHVNLFNGNLTL
ncbi:MAG: hypothetical protein PVG07_11875, partial [Acidobacteriota bacterium]